MNDDIVTRLREAANYVETDGNTWAASDCRAAADEIERQRAIIRDIANAVTDEGRKPGYHRQQVNYVRTMWNPLWQAISKAVNEPF